MFCYFTKTVCIEFKDCGLWKVTIKGEWLLYQLGKFEVCC